MGFFPIDPNDGDEIGPNTNGSYFKYVDADNKWILIPSMEVYSETEVDDLITAHEANPGDINHLTDVQVAALHPQLTNLTELGTRNHNDLLNIDAGDINHLTDVQVTALHTRLHAITDILDHSANNHKVFYSDGSGHVIELALGADGEVLTSTGANTAPAFEAVGGGGGSVKGTLTLELTYGGGTLRNTQYLGLTSTGFWAGGNFRITDNMDATIDMKIRISGRERMNVTRPSGTYNIGATKTDKTEEFLTTNIANATAWEGNTDKTLESWDIVLANASIDQGDLIALRIITDSNYDYDIFDISVEYTEAG